MPCIIDAWLPESEKICTPKNIRKKKFVKNKNNFHNLVMNIPGIIFPKVNKVESFATKHDVNNKAASFL